MNLEKLAQEHNVEYTDKGNGHIQLKGALLVNYYPNSKSKSAYVAGTKKAHKYVDSINAIRMCFSLPVVVSQNDKDKRSGNSRRKRAKMIKKGMSTCCWCSKPLDIDSSTIEHVIPLDRGGLDNANNRKLACEKCNQDRGNNMPELTT